LFAKKPEKSAKISKIRHFYRFSITFSLNLKVYRACLELVERVEPTGCFWLQGDLLKVSL
jgi:hypothetical protein